MNHRSHKLRHEQKQEAASEQQQQQKAEAKEFSSVEEMLRHDLAQTKVPGRVAIKLNKSIAGEPKPAKSWWKKLFGEKL